MDKHPHNVTRQGRPAPPTAVCDVCLEKAFAELGVESKGVKCSCGCTSAVLIRAIHGSALCAFSYSKTGLPDIKTLQSQEDVDAFVDEMISLRDERCTMGEDHYRSMGPYIAQFVAMHPCSPAVH